MTNRERYKRALKRLLMVSIVFTVIYTCHYVEKNLPDRLHIVLNEQDPVCLELPVYGSIYSDCAEVVLMQTENTPQKEVRVNGQDTFYIRGNALGSYEVVYRLFGCINFKNIEVEVVEEQELLPGGMTVGLYLQTNGVLVVGTADILSEAGAVVSPAKDLLQSGDYITAINHEPIYCKEELVLAVKNGKGAEMTLTVERDGVKKDVVLSPAKTAEQVYQLGVWVRDDTQGIGTMTYIDTNGNYGALGHAISDTDLGQMLVVEGGVLRKANIHAVIKGTLRNPGSLAGTIGYGEEDAWGTILENTKQGVFGTLKVEAMQNIFALYQESHMKAEYLQVGYPHEVKEGTAYIRSSVSGELKDYEIKITRVSQKSEDTGKEITFQVTDEELLELTGGIVQGMSGSPVIQNGKLVGAVTHVLVNDPTRGYAIFIENMLETTEDISNEIVK